MTGNRRRQHQRLMARTVPTKDCLVHEPNDGVIGWTPINRYKLAQDYKKRQTEKGADPDFKKGIYSTAVQIIDKTVE